MKAPTKWLFGLQLNAAFCGAMVVSAVKGYFATAVFLLAVVFALTYILGATYPFTDKEDREDTYR